MNRKDAPNAAFACILSIGDEEYKLGCHHNLDSVRDGMEHDTIDADLLQLALSTLDQYPVSNEEVNKIREHLQAHANALDNQPANKEIADSQRRELEGNDSEALAVVSQQAAGPDGNAKLKESAPTNTVLSGEQTMTHEDTSEVITTNAADIIGPPGTRHIENPASKEYSTPVDTKLQEVKLNPDDPQKKKGNAPSPGPDKVSEYKPDDTSPPTENKEGNHVETVKGSDQLSESSVDEELDQTDAGAKLERCVSSILSDSIAEFKEKNGHEPNEEQRKKMESRAFAICKSQGLK